ncbi:FCD domain-containing protein [Arthrobacter sp. NPDC089319]|uniref:FCD domain-containing protein n=1 Tax=Arthrobacter sp. NPDC089319 TaxID=3155915 RepID=UPI0034245733
MQKDTSELLGEAASDLLLSPMVRRPLYKQVNDRITQLIKEGVLNVGDRLPSERALSASLGVSRHSLRQALSALQTRGLIEIRHGSGAYLIDREPGQVASNLAEALIDSTEDLPYVMETRFAIEPFITGLAAERSTPADLRAIRDALNMMEREIADGESGEQGDIAFHAAVLAAAHNPTLADFMTRLQPDMARLREEALAQPTTPQLALDAHHAILAAIEAGDRERAVRAAHDHLVDAAEALLVSEFGTPSHDFLAEVLVNATNSQDSTSSTGSAVEMRGFSPAVLDCPTSYHHQTEGNHMNQAVSVSLPTHSEIVASARAIVERLRANARESDQLKHLSDDSFQALQEAGLLQILVPRRCGGWEGQLTSVLEAATIVAEGCPAAAWYVMLANGNAWQLGGLDEEIQDELFQHHPGTFIAGAIMPNGTARKVSGGWLVSGRFNFVSGIRHASWLTFRTFVVDEEGNRGQMLAMYCPGSDVTSLNNWNTLGMRGSGSPDVELKEIFVPDSRVSVPMDQEVPSDAALRQATNLYRMPTVAAFPVLIASTILGAARRSLELYVARIRERTERYTERAKSESQAQLIRIASVSAAIKASEMLLFDSAQRFDAIVERDGLPALEDRAAIKWQAVYAIDSLRRAVTTLYDAAGGSAIYEESEFLSTFRNVHVASHHAACDFDPAAEMYGRLLVGLDLDLRAV